MIGRWLALSLGSALAASIGCEGGNDACTPGKSCESGSYCAFTRDTCGDRGFEGVCHREPQSCGNDDAPVCGCDGRTYPNDCRARQAGTDVRAAGACGVGAGGTAGADGGGGAAGAAASAGSSSSVDGATE